MKTHITNKIEHLLSVLNRDIERIRVSLCRLDSLREMLVKHDAQGLEELLRQIRADLDSETDNDAQRKQIRHQLAELLEIDFEQTKLSSLTAMIPEGEMKNELVGKHQILRKLTSKLKVEYASTQTLLTDCARFNNQLLTMLFDSDQHRDSTYDSKGSKTKQTENAFVNLKF